MTGLPVDIHPAALEEAEAAAVWYAKRSPRAADRFVAELLRAISTIVEAPDRWPLFEANSRRLVVYRFPYQLIYRVEENRIMIVAIAHTSRRPGYWQGRVE